MYRPLPRFLLRAPLLPVAAVWRGPRALLRHALGPDAVRLASPSLARATAGARKDRALERYARRAAFRPTPHGLLGGRVHGDARAIGRRSRRARRTAHLAPSWARIEAFARALLDDPELRARTRLRVAPSALRGAGVVRWLGPGTAAAPDDVRAPSDAQTVRPADPFDVVHEAELVEPLPAILAAAQQWTPWNDVRAAAGAHAGGEPDDVDELLLTLIDDGLLHSDLTPPIVGAAAGAFMRARLDALGEVDAARALEHALDALAAGDLARGAAGLASLPGSGDDAGVHAVLVHRPRRPPTLERAAVERAARLAPLLVRLQDALAPPAAERFAQPALADALDAATELFGGGAFDVGALGAGDYGVELHAGNGNGDGSDDDSAAQRPPDTRVMTLLLDAIAAAGRQRRVEATLDPRALETALRDVPGPRLPCSAELFVAPVARRPRQPPGTGWLLGLHAPAAASLGRFGHALGADAIDAIDDAGDGRTAGAPAGDLRRCRLRADAGADRSGGAPADVASHARAVAAGATPPMTPTPAASSHPGSSSWSPIRTRRTRLALRERATGTPIVPASLRPPPFANGARRDRPAAGGLEPVAPARLVGAAARPRWRELAFIPRLCLDGFVVAPASWRLPAPTRGTPAAIRRWRQAAAVPRHVQVGEGDELLPVDLRARRARPPIWPVTSACSRFWPPLDGTVDRDGRRLEAVVMLVEEPDARETSRHAQRRRHDSIGRRRAAAGARARPRGLADVQAVRRAGHGRTTCSRACCRAIRARPARGRDRSLVLPALRRWARQPTPPPRPRRGARWRQAGCVRGRLRRASPGPRAPTAIVTVRRGRRLSSRARSVPRRRARRRPRHLRVRQRARVHAAAAAAQIPIERIGLLVRAIDALAAGLGLASTPVTRSRSPAAGPPRRPPRWTTTIARGADAAFRRAGRGAARRAGRRRRRGRQSAGAAASSPPTARASSRAGARPRRPTARARLLPDAAAPVRRPPSRRRP